MTTDLAPIVMPAGPAIPATPAPVVLWEPPTDTRTRTEIGRYLTWLQKQRGLIFDSYANAWRWSVDDLEGFWSSIWDFFDVTSHTPYEQVLEHPAMPGSVWFRGATLNYAEHALRRCLEPREPLEPPQPSGPDERLAVIAHSQTRPPQTLTASQLCDQVARVRAGLQRLGIGRGDRVAAYLPNIPETVVAFLATASLGAIWSSCAPEFGTRSVVDRFQQIEPKLLLVVDGYQYGDKQIDRWAEVRAIRAALGSLKATVVVPYLSSDRSAPASRAEPQADGDTLSWTDLIAQRGCLEFEPVAFDHPLYVLYSSGTTGLPKAIVHGHGGVLLEHLKSLALHLDLRDDDRFFWFTTTGWMMWNFLVSGLLVGAAVVLFDGDPGYPDLSTLWRLAHDTATTYLGLSAPFIMSCRKAGLRPGRQHDVTRVRAIGSTGSPLPTAGFEWTYEAVGRDLLLGSLSGGTDVCTAFVGPCPLVPVYAGEISCRWLGAKVEAYDASGHSVVGQQGELVVTAPMPSMPVGLWGDDGSRYRAAYFDDFPGVWRHGDWITLTERGSCVITGRSDATLNRGGVRLGTAEFYSVVEGLPEVVDSLVLHLEDAAGGTGELLLFVVLAPGVSLDDELRRRIATNLRTRLSPRHVPDRILAVPGIPRTLSGKKVEVPIKRILAGTPADAAVSRGALADPSTLKPFEELAEHRG